MNSKEALLATTQFRIWNNSMTSFNKMLGCSAEARSFINRQFNDNRETIQSLIDLSNDLAREERKAGRQ